ncbi:hypothetical protein [Mesorhizobium sp. M1272]|uniref:hypothetical protein n=1 Tax=Mesorhizobium sp. M1272 TaxID=2957074 RepID=UPI003335485E
MRDDFHDEIVQPAILSPQRGARRSMASISSADNGSFATGVRTAWSKVPRPTSLRRMPNDFSECLMMVSKVEELGFQIAPVNQQKLRPVAAF